MIVLAAEPKKRAAKKNHSHNKTNATRIRLQLLKIVDDLSLSDDVL